MNGDRGDHDPRVLARQIPDAALIVALVYTEAEGDDGAAAADSLARELGHRREHTLLTSAASGPSPLDLLLGGADGAGLPGALQGRAGLTDIAIQPVDRPFVYLPAGRQPERMTRLLTGDLFASFVERIRERGGTLLLLIPEQELADAAVRDLLDGYVALGDAVHDVPSDVPTYGRVGVSLQGDGGAAVRGPRGSDDGPVEVAGEGSAEPADVSPQRTHELAGGFELDPVLGAGEDIDPDLGTERVGLEDALGEGDAPETAVPVVESAGASAAVAASDVVEEQMPSWRRHRARAAFPARRVAIGAGAVAVLVVGWWLIASAMRGPAGAEAEPTMSAPAASTGGEEVVSEPEPPALTPEEVETAVATAPELPYSVLVASYAARSDAEDRLLRLRQGPGGPYFVVPTLIRGALYHRVFAGARPDAESARALMTELVESGRKDDASSWHIRPARLAYLLGAYGTRAEARARQEAVAAAGVPAYTLSAALGEGTGPDSVFQVYAGAYESPVAARALIPLLESAEEEAELVSRRGRRP